MNLNGTEYYYIRNGQGDITGLFDGNGAEVVKYTYDTWGRLIAIAGTLADTVGVKNPYRYRGYRYDSETGLYYLQSRYYNPEWGRFVNADSTEVLKELAEKFTKEPGKHNGELIYTNLFAYCGNNPVMNIDTNGRWFWINVLVSVAATVIDYWITHPDFDTWNITELTASVVRSVCIGVAFAGLGKAFQALSTALESGKYAKSAVGIFKAAQDSGLTETLSQIYKNMK